MGTAIDAALAFHEPQRLKDRARDHEKALGLLESVEVAMSKGESIMARIAEADRIARASVERERMESEPGGME